MKIFDATIIGGAGLSGGVPNKPDGIEAPATAGG